MKIISTLFEVIYPAYENIFCSWFFLRHLTVVRVKRYQNKSFTGHTKINIAFLLRIHIGRD